MSYLPVDAIHEPNGHPIMAEIGKLCMAVKQRAFEFLESRGFEPGHELEDWLKAERELLAAPPAELKETENEMELRMAAPGFELKEIHVTALPNQYFIQASRESKKETEEGRIHWSQFSKNDICRRVELPMAIDVDSAKALLSNGILTVTANKAVMAKPKKVAIAAAA